MAISSSRVRKNFRRSMKGQIENRIHTESLIWIRLKVLRMRDTPYLLSTNLVLFFVPGGGGGGRRYDASIMLYISGRFLFHCCLLYSRISS